MMIGKRFPLKIEFTAMKVNYELHSLTRGTCGAETFLIKIHCVNICDITCISTLLDLQVESIAMHMFRDENTVLNVA